MNLDYGYKVPTIIFDLDGTITDFEKIDNRIIREEIFSNCNIVLAIDKLAWDFNRLDILKNTTIMLKLRLFLYSILSKVEYSKVLNRYNDLYLRYSKQYILKHKKLIKFLKAKGYHIIVLSNNKLADNLYLEEAEITSVNSKLKALQKLKKYCDIECFVGNNLMDDIIPAKANAIVPIYRGRSPLKKVLKKFKILTIPKIECLKKFKKSG